MTDSTVIGPALDVQITVQYGRYCTKVKINSLQIEKTVSWVVISRGLDRYVTPFSRKETQTQRVREPVKGRFLTNRAQGKEKRCTS